jgi:predicted HTH domain antitoxin
MCIGCSSCSLEYCSLNPGQSGIIGLSSNQLQSPIDSEVKMAEKITTKPTFWETELETIRSVGPWQTETEVIRDAIDALLSSRSELRQAVAVKLYLQDKVTLSRAAEIASMNIWQFRDHLRAQGIAIVVPEETSEDLDAMIASFRRA